MAFVMVAVGDLGGSGGTERHFCDLYEHLARRNPGGVAFVTARASLARLRAAGRLETDDHVIALPLGGRPAGGKAGVAWMTMTLLWVTLTGRFDVVHLGQPTSSYAPFAALLTRVPRALRPKLVMTVTDCTLAPNLTTHRPADLYEQQVVDGHLRYFRWSRLDGVYSWYQAFVEVALRLQLLPAEAVLTRAQYCFTDPNRFRPLAAKDRVIVHAGRLSHQKRPLLFVDAIAQFCTRYPDLADGWAFEMYGSGVLEQAVRTRIEEHTLGRRMTLSHTPDLSPVFARTRLFVSTQAFENFTSLAMLEAMAAGNAVIAEDAGQTREFVRPGDNGLVVPVASPDAYADAIAEYVRHPERHQALAAESRRLATEVHTIEHFADDITAFWRDVVRPARR